MSAPSTAQTTAVDLDEILTPANQDAIASNMLNRMTPAARTALLDGMTPRERRAVEKAIARTNLRRRTRTAWSTEKIRRVILDADTTVTIYPADKGGWKLEAEGLILATDGTWIEAGTAAEGITADDIWEDYIAARTVWTSQAAAVEALAATL